MRKEIHNPLILLEASRRIELLYTDLQSSVFRHKNRYLGQKKYQDICRTRHEPDTRGLVGSKP